VFDVNDGGQDPGSADVVFERPVVLGATARIAENGVSLLDQSGAFAAHPHAPQQRVVLRIGAGEGTFDLLQAGVLLNTENK
jgi:hypothetical protein